MRLIATAMVLTVGLTGCATVFSGTSQNMSVNIHNTSEANCDLRQGHQSIAKFSDGSRIVRVSKRGDDIEVRCNAPGFQNFTKLVNSKISAGGAISLYVAFATLLFPVPLIDWATGAFWSYPANVDVYLQPDPDATPSITDHDAEMFRELTSPPEKSAEKTIPLPEHMRKRLEAMKPDQRQRMLKMLNAKQRSDGEPIYTY